MLTPEPGKILHFLLLALVMHKSTLRALRSTTLKLCPTNLGSWWCRDTHPGSIPLVAITWVLKACSSPHHSETKNALNLKQQQNFGGWIFHAFHLWFYSLIFIYFFISSAMLFGIFFVQSSRRLSQKSVENIGVFKRFKNKHVALTAAARSSIPWYPDGWQLNLGKLYSSQDLTWFIAYP